MNISGEWVAALALNAVRHRMGSARAIETVTRWVRQHRDGNGSRGKGGASVSIATSPTLSRNAAFKMAV